jgi:ABC-2 type transport system permease protein
VSVTSYSAPADVDARLPGAWSLGLRRAVLETKLFFRDRDAVAFTFAFPVMLLVLFGSIFSGEVEGTGVDAAQVMVAGILAAGVASVSFVTLAISIALERENGTLTRLAGTPMPRASYFLGKVGVVLVTTISEAAIVLGVGVVLYDLQLPSDPSRWLTFAWVFILGVSACALLGIAMSCVPRSARSAAAVVNLPFVALEFVSGVFVLYSALPAGLQTVGALFPLKWMAQGFRSVFLPDSFLVVEPAGSWEHPRMALVLGAWTIAGALLCRVTFRWNTERVRA